MQHRTKTGYADRVYFAPHGCAWLERFDSARDRREPYKLFVRVHNRTRTLTPPLPRDLLEPEFQGFCGPRNFIVHWPYVTFSAGQRLPAGAGRNVCANEILWIAQISQYATFAQWQTFKARTWER